MTAVSPFVVRPALRSKASTSFFRLNMQGTLPQIQWLHCRRAVALEDSESQVGAIDEHKSESDDESTYQAIG